MKRIISFLSGSVMGALVGSTLVLLLTPSSGEEIRTKMTDHVKKIQDEVRKAAENRRIELEEQLNTLRQPQ